MQEPLNNMQKVALLLVSLEPESSAQILKHLDPETVERITDAMASLGKVTNQTKRVVLREFRSLVAAREEPGHEGSYAEQLFEQSFEADRAKSSATMTTQAPDFLATLSPRHAADLLSSEPVHIIALLLATIAVEQSAAVLACLPETLQAPVAMALASSAPPSPAIRRQLDLAIRGKAGRSQRDEPAAMPAPAPPPVVSPCEALAAPSALDQPNPALTTAHADFEAMLSVGDPALRALLEGADLQDLGLALRGVSETLQAATLRALSFRRRFAVQAVLRSPQPVRLGDITEAQARVVAGLGEASGDLHGVRGEEYAHV